MKKLNKNKKGFTIVELVIVIAVIAILAAVLIPTFSGVVKKANMSAAEQRARVIYEEVYALDISDGTLDGKDGNTTIVDTSTKAITSGYTTGEKILTTGETISYTTINGAVTEFKYCNGKYIVTYTYSSNTWAVEAGTSLAA